MNLPSPLVRKRTATPTPKRAATQAPKRTATPMRTPERTATHTRSSARTSADLFADRYTFTDMDSPLGRLRLVARGGALAGVYLPDHRRGVPNAGHREPGEPVLVAAARQLAEYFDKRRTTFDLPFHAEGTPFQRAVWTELAAIPYGETRAYSELARAIGRPRASRAVGAANGQNPLSIIVPCHRVLGLDGRLHGYAGGEAAKRWLLDHEAR